MRGCGRYQVQAINVALVAVLLLVGGAASGYAYFQADLRDHLEPGSGGGGLAGDIHALLSHLSDALLYVSVAGLVILLFQLVLRLQRNEGRRILKLSAAVCAVAIAQCALASGLNFGILVLHEGGDWGYFARRDVVGWIEALLLAGLGLRNLKRLSEPVAGSDPCRGCGQELARSLRFCPSCGTAAS
jgi:hypothetical protein